MNTKKLTTVRCQLKVLSQEHLLKVFCGSIFYYILFYLRNNLEKLWSDINFIDDIKSLNEFIFFSLYGIIVHMFDKIE